MYGLDDAVIAVATFVALGYFASAYLAIHYGAGKTWAALNTQGQLGALNEACSLLQKFEW